MSINNLGPIKLVIPNNFDDDDKPLWEGSISKQARIENDASLASKIEAALNPDFLENYFVPTDASAPDECIDGRRLEGYENNEDLRRRGLGAQVPGGSCAASVAYRVAAKDGYSEGETILDDFEYVISQYAKNGISYGAHIDDHASGNFTGCGAIDKMPIILRKFSQFEAVEQLYGLVKYMLGENFNEDTFHLLSGRLLRLQGNKSQYLARDENGEYTYRKRLIDDVREAAGSPENVEKLIGSHNEVGLIINAVPDTTFNRDQYSLDHEDSIQLFNYDFWRNMQVAALLHPLNYSMSVADQYLAIRARNEFITFSAMYGVATAMVLTDGTIDLLVRS